MNLKETKNELKLRKKRSKKMSTTVLGERILSQAVAKEPRAGRSDKENNINLNLLHIKF